MKSMLKILFFLFVCSEIFAQSSEIISWNSLDAYFRFDGDYFDQVDDRRLVSHYNTDFKNGKCGNSLYFNGADAYLQLPETLRLKSRRSYTMAFWIKTKQTSRFDILEQRIGDWSPDNSNVGIYFNCPNGETDMIHFHFPNFNGDFNYSTLKINNHEIRDGNWHHLVFVKDVDKQLMTIYFDARRMAERSIIDIEFEQCDKIIIGKSYKNEHYFKGELDELAFFNKALDEIEIGKLFESCTPESRMSLDTNIVAYNDSLLDGNTEKILKELDIARIREGQLIQIDELYFDADKSEIGPTSLNVMREIFSFLNEHKGIKVEVGGHTNSQPSPEYCDSLSTLRAQTVAKFLIDRGISPERAIAKGYGKRKPIASNNTKAGRQMNQRVELKILEINKDSTIQKAKPVDRIKSNATGFWYKTIRWFNKVKAKLKRKK